jgi:hypothetical protein
VVIPLEVRRRESVAAVADLFAELRSFELQPTTRADGGRDPCSHE